MRNLHQRVIDDDSKVVRGVTVGANEHRVTDDFAAERDIAADDIVERYVYAGWHLETDDRMLALVHPRARLVGRELTAGAGLSWWTPRGQHFAAVLIHP